MQENKVDNDSLISIVKRSFQLIYPLRKNQFHLLLLVLFFVALIDVLSFTSIVPVIYLINNSAPIEHNQILHLIYTTLQFKSNTYFILFLLILIVLIFLFKNLFLFFSSYLQNKFIFSIAGDLLERQFKRFYNASYIDIKNSNSVEYLRYTTTAPLQFATDILQLLIIMLYESIIVLFISVALIFYYPNILLLVIITIVPASYLLLKISRSKLSTISQKKGALEVDLYKLSFQAINGYLDIKLFNKEQYVSNIIFDKLKQFVHVKTQTNLMELIPRRTFEIIIIATVTIIYAYVSILYNVSSDTVVFILVSFATAAYRLMPSVNDILFNIIGVKSSVFIFDYLAFFKDNKINESYESIDFLQQINLYEISYAYESNENVLRNCNLSMNKGDFVVVTGESGSGKSTLGKLLLAFIKPTNGTYKIDDKEVVNFNQVKNLVAYVTQDFFLFDKSLVENIAIGETNDEIDFIRINEVIKAANLTSFVQSLSDGIYHQVGENGAKISGGQKQRIAIARALYKNAQFLILDEITSSLGKHDELEIINTIYEISKSQNITVFMITHRTASVTKYDAMYEMVNGKLEMKL